MRPGAAPPAAGTCPRLGCAIGPRVLPSQLRRERPRLRIDPARAGGSVMPSKGGRGTTTTNPAVGPPVVAGPAVGRPREEWDAAGFTAAEIGRALPPGIDAERLNELATRDAGVGPQ